jgi:hypothetical protein
MSFSYGDAATVELVQDAALTLSELQRRIRAGEGPKKVTQQQREALTRTRAFLAEWAEDGKR